MAEPEEACDVAGCFRIAIWRVTGMTEAVRVVPLQSANGREADEDVLLCDVHAEVLQQWIEMKEDLDR